MDGYDDTTYGDRWADVYDEWYEHTLDTDATVEFVRAIAGPPDTAGTILELGIGTGRLAVPLATLGYDIRGIDTSPAMLDRLAAKPGGATVPVARTSMAAPTVPPRDSTSDGRDAPTCSGVLVAYNTLFNLATFAEQQSCIDAVAQLLVDGGWFVCNAFVPDTEAPASPRGDVAVRSMTADRVVLTADVVDRRAQTISGQFIDISDAGVRLRPFHLRYLLPEQLDALATSAGLRLEGRWEDWTRTPFTADSATHVSLYRR